jgi:hypothetical protein
VYTVHPNFKIQKKYRLPIIAGAAIMVSLFVIPISVLLLPAVRSNSAYRITAESAENAEAMDLNDVTNAVVTRSRADTALSENTVIADNTNERVIAAEARLFAGAELVYENVFNDALVVTRETLPVFLAGKTLGECGMIFSDWSLAEFTPSRVVLRRSIDKSAESYIIGIYGGFVAVFYDLGFDDYGYGLINRVTDKPVSALSGNERGKLTRGVRVFGEESLIRYLQDYDS